MISANCEWPIASTRKRNRRSKPYGLASSSARRSPIRRSTSVVVAAVHTGAHALEREQMLAPRTVGDVGLDVLGEPVVARERAGEDHAGVVAHRVGQAPAVGELGAERGGLVAHHQRDAGVAQCVEAGADREPCGRIERLVARRVDGELLHDVQRRVRPASLITSAGSSMVSKLAPPASLLTSRVMCMSAMRARVAVGHARR